MNLDFSSDKILDSYATLNNLDWSRDADVCEMCGRRFDEIENDCPIEACTFEIEKEVSDDKN